MTAPAGVYPLGAGTLKLGQIGAPVDFSCLVNSGSIKTSASTSDPVTKLCGTMFPGVVTLTGQLAADLDLDLSTDGLFQLSSQYAARLVEFRYMPNDDSGLEARGKLVILPMNFGSDDDYGTTMHDGSIAWDIVGDVAFYRNGTLAWTQKMGAHTAANITTTVSNAGVYPANSEITASDPTNAAKLAGLGYLATPQTAWTTGQKFTVGSFDFNWSGTAFAAGAHA